MPTVVVSHNVELGPEIPNDIKEIAVKHGEDPDIVCSLIQNLREMIYEKGDCQPHRSDDEYLIRFLRGRFWKLDPSYRLLCNYCKFRESNRELYEKVHPLNLKMIGDADLVSVAPYRDQDNHRMIIFRFGNWKPDKIPVNDIFKATLILLEIGALEPITQILGAVVIFDLANLSLTQIMHLRPSIAQMMMALMVTSMPVRTTAIHIINQNWLFKTAFNIFKPFLNARMKERIFIHGTDLDSLKKHINAECLPKQYGGVHEEYPYQTWLESLSGNEIVRKELEGLGYIFPTNFQLP